MHSTVDVVCKVMTLATLRLDVVFGALLLFLVSPILLGIYCGWLAFISFYLSMVFVSLGSAPY